MEGSTILRKRRPREGSESLLRGSLIDILPQEDNPLDRRWSVRVSTRATSGLKDNAEISEA